MNPFGGSYLAHVGTPHDGSIPHSGRYEYGSGDNPYQRAVDFTTRVEKLRHKGFTYTDPDTGRSYTGDAAIAKYLGMSIRDFKAEYSNATNQVKANVADKVVKLREEGKGWTEIARELNLKSESSARSIYDTAQHNNYSKAKEVAEYLKGQVDEKGMINVGIGVAQNIGVSQTRMNAALKLLEEEGYYTAGGRIPQLTNPENKTTLKVLCPPDTEFKISPTGKRTTAAIFDYGNIHQVDAVIFEDNEDGTTTSRPGFQPPTSIDSDRVYIRYKDEVGPDGHTGVERDGLVQIRPGVADLSLGESHYSQVRIMVDGDHYIKGMAVYSDDIPEGYDIVFNTNKPDTTSKMKVLKECKTDAEGNVDMTNPFGSLIKEDGGQSTYIDPDTGETKLSAINKRADEGDWGEWAKKLPSQFLSKQSLTLAKQQLKSSMDIKDEELQDILSVENPTLRRELLMDFADGADKDSVTLKATSLPGQKYQVILPVASLKDDEIYAPNYKDGEKVACVRYPHEGTFAIPILTVNNSNAEAQSMITNQGRDAVGITAKVAERLSGADFDGDTVMVIPVASSGAKVTSTPALKGLEGFDNKVEYGADSTVERTVVNDDGTTSIVTDYYRNGKKYKIMSEQYKQQQMGVASNLITDMTLQDATDDEKARAARYSMVVIDAVKHKLDYKACYEDCGIEELKAKYQVKDAEEGTYGGASTLISRAKSEQRVLKTQGDARINKKGTEWYDPDQPEGALIWKTADDAYWTDKNTGEVHTRTKASTKMAATSDASTLISSADTPMEHLYADYANHLKGLANAARKEAAYTEDIPYSRAAYETYKDEIDDLKRQISAVEANKPRETAAQIMATTAVELKKQAYPELQDKANTKELKKVQQQELSKARIKCGAKRFEIELTDRQWEAIQSGGVNSTTIKKIYQYSNKDTLKSKAIPRSQTTLSTSKITLMKTLRNKGYTTAEIADRLGVSASTVSRYTSKAG